MLWVWLAASACSALNPDFNLREDSATDTEPFDPTTATSTTGDGESSDTGTALDMPVDAPENTCVIELVELIEGCLHAAELSKPMDDPDPEHFWRHPEKADLLIFCTTTAGGIGANLWSGDVFLQTLGAEGTAIDPAVAYFDHTCSTGSFEWCQGTIADFRSELMEACFDEFDVGFEFLPFEPEPAVAEELGNLRDMFLLNDCFGRCERHFEMFQLDPKVAPTAGGDATRELLDKYVLSGAPELTRFDDGYLVDAPFAAPFTELQSMVGTEGGWIGVTLLDHGPEKDCPDFQHRAMVGVHHDRRLVVMMAQSECLLK